MSGCHVPKTNEVKMKIDIEMLIKRIITIENFIGQNYKVDYKDLIDMIGNLSMKLNEMQSKFREFEKQVVAPIGMRLTELEDWTRKDEDRIYSRIDDLKKIVDHLSVRVEDFEDRLDELEEGDY